jgi:Cu/Ag efflux protein CusF
METLMSKKAVAPVALILLAAVSTTALAAAQTKTGDIKTTDSAKHEITLASGDTFEVGSKVKLEKFKAGDKVAVTYETKDGKMMASKIHHAK